MRSGRKLPAAMAVTVVLIAGCGSSNSGLSKSQLASKVNSICSQYNPKLNAVPRPTNASDVNAVTQYFGQLSPILHQRLAQIQSLKPASNVRGQWNDLVSKYSSVAQVVDTLKAALSARSATVIQSLSPQVAATESAATSAATNLGATGCNG